MKAEASAESVHSASKPDLRLCVVSGAPGEMCSLLGAYPGTAHSSTVAVCGDESIGVPHQTRQASRVSRSSHSAGCDAISAACSSEILDSAWK